METPVLTGPDLKFRRKKKLAMTQGELAAVLGCSKNHICNLEQLVRVPPMVALAVLQLEAMNREAA